MSELISRSALDVDLQNLVREYNRNCESDKSSGAFKALYHLRLAPAVDAVEVVRCKECKYFHQKFSCGGFCKCGEVNGGRPFARANDDFCSFAIRRIDDGMSRNT